MRSADYGTDAPGVIRNLLLCSMAALLVFLFAPRVVIGNVIIETGGFIWMSISCGTPAILMLLYSRFGKFKHRDAMLALVEWEGNEQVLDIGTGRGLLAIGAAKKLSTGNVTGIDIWNREDLSNNSEVNTMENARLEGVADRVRVISMDARKLEFADESFNIIVSNLCLHNIYDTDEREKALREIVRVLKKGGTGLICDFQHVSEYEKIFSASGLRVEKIRGSVLATFPPLTTLRISK
ncbi:MAG: class I SAM-dependent methyltransferase [Ignavibacteria bacterium]|nr:class I SAM-dependent methyltransferase [Ignavibacteria bacterium]